MRNRVLAVLTLVSASMVSGVAHADPVTVPCNNGVCIASLQNSNGVAYTVKTYDDGTNFVNVFHTSSPGALDFANIYFDTQTGTAADNGSNLGFEILNDRAFIPGVSSGGDLGSGYYSLAGTGIFFTNVVDPVTGEITITLTTPNSFFETDPTNIGFGTTAPGGTVTIHYSQAFGYDFLGGSDNFSLPNEIGGAVLPAAIAPTPEPASLSYMLLTGLAALPVAARRLRRK